MSPTPLLPRTDDDLFGLLQRSPTIAVVGMSTDPRKPSHTVPAALLAAGFQVIPVHRTAEEILGQRVFHSLDEITEPVDLVDVFRPTPELAGVARQAADIGADALWLQLGLRSDEARRIAEEARMVFVQDLCIKVEVHRLGVHHDRP